MNPEANAVWAKLGKPGGTFNRWLNALCYNEAKALGQDAEMPPTAQVEIAEVTLERHAQRDTGNKRIQCKSASLPYPFIAVLSHPLRYCFIVAMNDPRPECSCCGCGDTCVSGESAVRRVSMVQRLSTANRRRAHAGEAERLMPGI